jgi:hypothetical protein
MSSLWDLFFLLQTYNHAIASRLFLVDLLPFILQEIAKDLVCHALGREHIAVGFHV